MVSKIQSGQLVACLSGWVRWVTLLGMTVSVGCKSPPPPRPADQLGVADSDSQEPDALQLDMAGPQAGADIGAGAGSGDQNAGAELDPEPTDSQGDLSGGLAGDLVAAPDSGTGAVDADPDADVGGVSDALPPETTGDAVTDGLADVSAPDADLSDVAQADAAQAETGPLDAGPPAADAEDAAPVPWFPSWKDENGCENYQYFEDGKCKNDNPQQEILETVLCWKHGQVNSLGVGKPCMPGLNKCAGFAANCCTVDAKLYGALCTMPCTKNSECGPEAYCHYGAGGPLCFPQACTELFDVYYANAKKKDKGFACAAGPNSKGVGTLCKAGGAACAGIAGSYCLGDGPVYLPVAQPGLSSFCTLPCASNADCGADAQCIFSNGKPYFCSPSSCAGQFANLLFFNTPGKSELPGETETCVPE